MALFAGSAAQATDESLLRWKTLWENQRQANQQYDLSQQQFEFQANLTREQQAFQERLAKAQEAFQIGVLDRNEAFEIGKLSLDRLPDMGLDEQWNLVEWLQGSGNPLATVAKNSVRASLFDNFADAANLVDSVFTAPIGTPINSAFARLALDAVIGRSGMDETAAEEFRTQFESALEARAGDAEAWQGLQWDTARTQLDAAKANVDQTRAQTGVYTAQEASIWRDIALNDELKTYVVDQARLINEQLSLSNNQQSIINGNLPAQLAAELENLQARTRELDNGATLFNRTLEHIVAQQAAATGLAQEDLRHALATGMWRDGIVKGNLAHLRATVDYVDAQEAESRARAEGLHTQNEAAILDMSVTRTQLLGQLVEWGRADLLGELGGQLLTGLGIEDPDKQAALLESLQSTASSRLSNAEKLEKAQVDLAVAEADFANWRNENAPLQQEIENQFKERGLDLQEESLRLQGEGLKVEWARANAYAASLKPTPGGANVPLTDVHNAIKNGIGISIGDINQSIEDFGTWEAADRELSNAVTLGENGEPVAYDAARLRAVAAQYGITDADMLGEEELFRSVQGLVRANATTTRARAEADTLSYVRAWISETGRMPTAADLGFASGDPIYLSAMSKIPGFSLTTEVATSVEQDILQLAEHLSPEIGVDGALFGSAASVWESLVETHGTEALANAGYADAGDLIDPLNRAAGEYAQARSMAEEAARNLGMLSGTTFDLEDEASRMNLEQMLGSYERTADTLIGMINELPSAWDRAMGGIPARRAATAQDQQVVSSVTAALQIPRDSLIERGIISPDGVITDRAQLLQLLTNYQGNLANQRSAVQLIDGRLRAR